MEHFDSPPDEVAPKGNIPPELAFQQRYYPHTGVKWGEPHLLQAPRLRGPAWVHARAFVCVRAVACLYVWVV